MYNMVCIYLRYVLLNLKLKNIFRKNYLVFTCFHNSVFLFDEDCSMFELLHNFASDAHQNRTFA